MISSVNMMIGKYGMSEKTEFEGLALYRGPAAEM